MPPDITPDDVATYAPASPGVSADHCELAQDWAAWMVKRSKVDPATLDSRELREVKRAECAYALHVAAAGLGAGGRTSAGAGALKSVEVVGEIKIERAIMTTEQSAASAGAAADTWLQRARAHLRAAGVSVWQSVVGASR
ncbi:hypothetical protein EHF33_20680 (plasmid) [Deinococcus psychrotolerans]|uniref:Uncharacterized protein n=1 Tax=Deinococcus psychrotolerans TaxID=2489213 RepID=A0A3G8YJ84_9DEIO|nr:hypothetical protein [Deinococcus psychrotolerans]AZI45328.1 hypothetical protein EHF33_20680 [Deinococcus psychrotolerans]